MNIKSRILKLAFLSCALLLCFLACAPALYADEEFIHDKANSSENISTKIERVDVMTLPRLVKTLVSLVLVCSLAIVLLRQFAKRKTNFMGYDQWLGKNSARRLKLVEKLTINNRTQIILIELDGEKELIVSVSDHGIQILSEGNIKHLEKRTKHAA
jgi:flagellar biogenesis protein FliO